MMMLESARLILRPWEECDAPAIAAGLNDYAVAQWLTIPFPYTLDMALNFIQSQNKSDAEYQFAIINKATGEVIGGTTLRNINPFHGTAAGGIWLGSAHHGHGYGTEAFNARIRFAFEQLNLRRIENGYFAGNEASRRMQLRLGYREEGMRRKSLFCPADGQYKNEYLTGLLREEWVPADK